MAGSRSSKPVEPAAADSVPPPVPQQLEPQERVGLAVVLLAQHDQVGQVVAAPVHDRLDVVDDEVAQAGLRPAVVLRSAAGPVTGESVAHQAGHPLLVPVVAGTLAV